jgi:dsRNA-specific ribonuclease
MDNLLCARSIRFQKREGKEVAISIPKPNLTAPSPKERTVPEVKKIGSVNTDFLANVGRKVPSKADYSDKDLFKYLKELLMTFLEEDKIPALLNKESMKLWRRSFTHITYDPEDNYETLESVGDKVLSYTFKTMLYQRFPDITASELNNLDQHYMSTHLQSLMSAKMGLSNWLRVNGEVPKTSEKIREDLYESFFGTIDTIMIKKYGLGYGVRICMKFMEKIFDIGFNRDIEPAKTFVFQMFERLGAKEGITSSTEQIIQDDQSAVWRSRVVINEIGLDLLRKAGKDLGMTPKTWTATKMTKKPVEQAVYAEVMYYLLERGITTKWVQDIKRDTVIDTQIGKDNYSQILSKAKNINPEINKVDVIEAYKSKPAKTVYQIIGFAENKKIALETISSHEDKLDGFQSVIKKFLRK